jgi:PIN domain nuclease of toxin-antitoxin system
MTKLLIDECLSAELALMARERGHQVVLQLLALPHSVLR